MNCKASFLITSDFFDAMVATQDAGLVQSVEELRGLVTVNLTKRYAIKAYFLTLVITKFLHQINNESNSNKLYTNNSNGIFSRAETRIVMRILESCVKDALIEVKSASTLSSERIVALLNEAYAREFALIANVDIEILDPELRSLLTVAELEADAAAVVNTETTGTEPKSSQPIIEVKVPTEDDLTPGPDLP